MKQKDYVLIAATAIFSGVMSIIISGIFISPSSERSQTAEVVEPISDEFRQPPQQYFNKDSVNPTKLIEISPTTPGEGSPFGNQ